MHAWVGCRAILVCLLTVASLSVSETCAAQLTVSTTQLNFGSLYLGKSATQSVTVTNTGTIPVFFFQPFLSGDFSYQTNCPFYAAGNPVIRWRGTP